MRPIDADNLRFTGEIITDSDGDAYVLLSDVQRMVAQAPTLTKEALSSR